NCRLAPLGALGERSETNGVRRLSQALPCRSPFQKIPGRWLRDFVLRMAFGIELDVHYAGRMVAISLHMIDVEAKLLQLPQGFQPARILTHAAGHDALIPHQGSDISKVRGGSAQA